VFNLLVVVVRSERIVNLPSFEDARRASVQARVEGHENGPGLAPVQAHLLNGRADDRRSGLA